MNEREIFQSAVEIADDTERQQYLDSACGPNRALREQVEQLLRAHEAASQFLAVPAAAQLTPNTDDVAEATTYLPKGETASSSPDDDAVSLEFLEPSTKPGSRGRLAHYEVLEVLGRGAFGIVLKAFDEKLHRMVAIKVLNPELAATSPPRKRFLREAQSSAKIRHENIVSIYAVEEQPLPYIVMEYIPGGTLQQRLDQTGPLAVEEILRLGQQIALGLAAAHAQGLIHRDIKPANILMGAGVEERVKITDFGLARATDDASLTQSGLIAGTPMYMAPEQAKGQTLDHRTDLFSLGSVLYTMASGRPPFRAPNTIAVLKRVCEDTPRPIREVIPETPSWLSDIIGKLQAKEPDDRFQSAREVADVLGQYLAYVREPMTAPRPVPVAMPVEIVPLVIPTSPRSEKTKRWSLTTVLLAVLIGILIIPLLAIILIVIAIAIPAYQAAQSRSTAAMQDNQPLDSQTIHVRAGQNHVARWPDKPGSILVDVSPSATEWQPLFNGRDFTGWEMNNHWSIENDSLLSRVPKSMTKTPAMLVTQNKNFRDFHARIEAKINNGGDSGLFFRFGEKGDRSIQAQITAAPSGIGSLLRHATTVVPTAASVRPNTWFTLEVLAQGPNITVLVDGVEVVNWFDPTGEIHTGPLALEAGFPGTEFFVRKVEVKRLPPPTIPSPAIAPFDAAQAKTYQAAWAKHLGLPVEYTNDVGMKFRLIPPGEFRMGSPAPVIDKLSRELEQAGANDFEKFVARGSGPQHRVHITKAFYLGEHEVTVGQYRRFIANKKYLPTMQQLGIHRFKWEESAVEPNAEDRAVVGISWDDAQAFCNWVSDHTGLVTEIPTEAQWEYACRGGTETLWSFGNDPSQLSEYAVFGRPGFIPAEVVGSKKPNPFGLFDMHGNADEWCRDWHDKDFYAKCPVDDPVMLANPSDKNSGRVARGGTSHSAAWWTYSTTRPWDFPATPNTPKGFRVMMTADAVREALQAAPAGPVSALEPENDWQSLFNGKNLSGWKTHPDKPGMWRTENGAIVGDSHRELLSLPLVGNYLFSERGDFANFHLRCEVHINSSGDAGILLRTPFSLVTQVGIPGYEAQIQGGKLGMPGWHTGAIASVTSTDGWRLRQASDVSIRAEEWFPMEVIAVGTHIETWVAGKKVAEFNDPDRLHTRGHIALQQSNPNSRVMFRKIQVRPLSP